MKIFHRSGFNSLILISSSPVMHKQKEISASVCSMRLRPAARRYNVLAADIDVCAHICSVISLCGKPSSPLSQSDPKLIPNPATLTRKSPILMHAHTQPNHAHTLFSSFFVPGNSSFPVFLLFSKACLARKLPFVMKSSQRGDVCGNT